MTIPHSIAFAPYTALLLPGAIMMAYIQIEASVRTHYKFLKAGPDAGWLYVCGLGYCQDGLTDGHIPAEALAYLGVPIDKAGKLATKLVLAGLWDACDGGGWQVHDYLKHNKSAAAVNAIKVERRRAGKHGGIASGQSRQADETKQVASTVAEASVEAVVEARVEPVSALLVSPRFDSDRLGSTHLVSAAPLDVWFKELRALYPENRTTSGHLTETAYFDVFQRDSRPALEVWAEMRGNLVNNIGHDLRMRDAAGEPLVKMPLTDADKAKIDELCKPY